MGAPFGNHNAAGPHKKSGKFAGRKEWVKTHPITPERLAKRRSYWNMKISLPSSTKGDLKAMMRVSDNAVRRQTRYRKIAKIKNIKLK